MVFFSLTSHFAHDARSQEPKDSERVILKETVTKTTGRQEKRREWQRQKFWDKERGKQRRDMKQEGRNENTCENWR